VARRITSWQRSEAVPGARGITILADPTYTPPAQLQVLEDAARARGLKPVVLTAGKEAEIVPAIDKAKEVGGYRLPPNSRANREASSTMTMRTPFPSILGYPQENTLHRRPHHHSAIRQPVIRFSTGVAMLGVIEVVGGRLGPCNSTSRLTISR
jgi:hypothetical protein